MRASTVLGLTGTLVSIVFIGMSSFSSCILRGMSDVNPNSVVWVPIINVRGGCEVVEVVQVGSTGLWFLD